MQISPGPRETLEKSQFLLPLLSDREPAFFFNIAFCDIVTNAIISHTGCDHRHADHKSAQF